MPGDFWETQDESDLSFPTLSYDLGNNCQYGNKSSMLLSAQQPWAATGPLLNWSSTAKIKQQHLSLKGFRFLRKTF